MIPRASMAPVLLSLAAACTVGPRYVRPSAPVPPVFSEAPAGGISAEGASLARWWTGFQDPALDRLLVQAVAGNLDLQIASARLREERAARGIAASRGLPQVDASAAYSRARRSEAVPPFNSSLPGPSPFGSKIQDTFEAGFDASWEIDVFGGVRRDREAAQAQVEAAEEGRRAVLVTVVAEVARTYVELREAQQRLEILDATVDTQRDTLALVKDRFDAGLGTELDVTRAESQLHATESERPKLEQLVRVAVHALRVLLGGDPAALTPTLEAPGAIPAAGREVPSILPSELLSRRPDLRRAEREVAAATALVGVATADLFPRFAIVANYGTRSAEIGDFATGPSQFWSIIPGFRWPIFSGGRIRANIRVHEARQEQALREYEKAVLVAVEEVENALSAHLRTQRRRAELRASVDASRRALELARERYTGGLESFLSVLDAQRSLYLAEDLLVQSDGSTATDLIAVYKALGGGWEEG